MNSWAKQKGFTIVELLIVIVVIGILAAITIVAYNGVQSRARTTTVHADVNQLRKAVQILGVDTSKRPFGCSIGDGAADPEGFITSANAGVMTRPVPGNTGGCVWTQADADAWKGPYFSQAVDPWGRAYFYDNDFLVCESGTVKVIVAVLSVGPNGVEEYPTSSTSSPCTSITVDDVYEVVQ